MAKGAPRARTMVRTLGRIGRPPMIAGLVFGVTLSPILAPMIWEAVRFHFMVRPAEDLYLYSASVVDFFLPNRMHSLFRPGSYTWIGNQISPLVERTLSIGYAALALAVWGIWTKRKQTSAIWRKFHGSNQARFSLVGTAGRFLPGFTSLWLAAALFFALLALGPRIHLGNITWANIPPASADSDAVPGWTLFAVLNRIVPFMRISRSVSRYGLVVQLCVAVLAGMGLAAWLVRVRRTSLGTVVILCSLVLVVVEYWDVPYPLSPPDTPAFYTRLAALPGSGAVLNLPMNYDRPGYLLYQTVHHRPLTIAYISRSDPRTLTDRVPILQHFRHLGPDIIQIDPAHAGLTVLFDLGIEFVISDRYKMPSGRELVYTTDLAGTIFGGQTPFYADDRLTVYTVKSPQQLQPYLVLGPANWWSLEGQETGELSRALGDGPADVYVRHAPPGVQLQIRYHTRPDVSIKVLALRGTQVLATLPPAATSRQVTLNLDDLRSRPHAAESLAAPNDGLSLLAQAAGGASVESLAVTVP